MEDEESRKKAFLQEGISDMISGKTSLQLTIRKWSANEIYFRKISQEIIGKSADKGAFMYSLQEEISQSSLKPANRKIITEGSNRIDLPGVTTGQSNWSSCHQP